MDNLSEENANENIKIFSNLLIEIEKVKYQTDIFKNCFKNIFTFLFTRCVKCLAKKLSNVNKVCFLKILFV
jgi:hypothetical protein